MVEARVLALVAPRLERLALHQPRTCGADQDHNSPIDPELGCMDIERNAIPDAAVYTCRADRCEWRRLDRLKEA
jgi:hypothetical protein